MGKLTVFSSLSVVPREIQKNGWPKAVIHIDQFKRKLSIYENTPFGVLSQEREYNSEMARDCVFSNLKAGDVYLRDSSGVELVDYVAKLGFPSEKNMEIGDDNSSVLRTLKNIEGKTQFPIDVYSFLDLEEGVEGLSNGDEIRLAAVVEGEVTYLRVSARRFFRFHQIGVWNRVLSDEEIALVKSLRLNVKAASHGRRVSGSVYQTVIFEVPEDVSEIWSELKI